MKILVFSPYYPPHIGGLETHADEFNKYLSREGVSITVFTPRLPYNASESEIRHDTVKILRFPAFEAIHNYPLPKLWEPSFWKLFREATRQKPDVVISRTRFFSTSLVALVYAKVKRIPWLHIEHGSDFAQFNGSFKTTLGKLYDHIFGRLVLSFSDVNVANSNASAAFVKLLSDRDDCRVIYRGVETEKIANAPTNTQLRQKYEGRVIIGYIGRLIDGKGVKDLLSALTKIQNKNFVCYIVGDGPERMTLERLVQTSDLREKVVFFGNQPFAEAIGILKACDIFVNPSYTEGIPTAVIEAALCRKAIIATNVGGTPEIVTGLKGIILIKPKDTTSLTEKLEALISRPDLRETMGAKAFAEVEQKFSWPRAAKQYLEIFEKLITLKK